MRRFSDNIKEQASGIVLVLALSCGTTTASAEAPAGSHSAAAAATMPAILGFSAATPSVTIPFEPCAGHICIAVRINGAGPFHFLLDTGSRNVITRAVFDKLGLAQTGDATIQGSGYDTEQGAITTVRETALAGLTLRDQPFIVIPSPAAGSGANLDGTLGAEWFQRCPILIDYAARKLTFYDPASFRYAGKAKPTPLSFSGLTPQIDGQLDGVAGKFTLDTGSDLHLTLSTDFVASHDLLDKYAPAGVVRSVGLGGASALLTGQAGMLTLGGVAIAAPRLEFPTLALGAFAESDVAGNLGDGILRQMNWLFDYGKRTVYLEKNGLK